MGSILRASGKLKQVKGSFECLNINHEVRTSIDTVHVLISYKKQTLIWLNFFIADIFQSECTHAYQIPDYGRGNSWTWVDLGRGSWSSWWLQVCKNYGGLCYTNQQSLSPFKQIAVSNEYPWIMHCIYPRILPPAPTPYPIFLAKKLVKNAGKCYKKKRKIIWFKGHIFTLWYLLSLNSWSWSCLSCVAAVKMVKSSTSLSFGPLTFASSRLLISLLSK